MSILYLVYITLLSSIAEAKPCWCHTFGKKITKSSKLLIDRYGKHNLNSTSVLWSSGRTNALANRIYQHLQNQTPFRMGLVGGSFSIPEHSETNTWIANVTRWMDVILSSSKCDVKDAVLALNTGKCPGLKTPQPCLNLTLTSHPNHEIPVFCEPFKSDVVSASYHQGNRPLEHICASAHHTIQRYCSVYIGSGNFAQITSGAKGNTESRYGERYINRILDPTENLDFIFWDYSINDAANVPDNSIGLLLRFIPHVLKYHKNVIGFGFVYWGNTPYNGDKTTCYAHYSNNSNDVAELHLPFLKKYFHPIFGPYRNLTLITMSQGQFCRKAGCTKQDFIELATNHPSVIGLSRFADLVIWQFLRVFRQVYKDYCSDKSLRDKSNSSNSSHISWSIAKDAYHNHSFRSTSMIRAAKELGKILNYPVDATSGRRSFHPDFYVEDITVVASMPFSSPVIGKPLPVHQLAILCAPGISGIVDRRLIVAHESVEANITVPLRWVEMDITTVLREKCGGWVDRSLPSLSRHDADHEFRPTANTSCIDCPMPRWAGSDFPYGYWNDMPMFKKVDLVIRISTKLNWTHVCFTSCKPRFLWQERGVWKEGKDVIDYRTVIKDWTWRWAYGCQKKRFNPEADFHYLWYQADSCFRSTNRTTGPYKTWDIPAFSGSLGLVRID